MKFESSLDLKALKEEKHASEREKYEVPNIGKQKQEEKLTEGKQLIRKTLFTSVIAIK